MVSQPLSPGIELVQSLSSKLNGSGDDGLAESRGVRFMRMPHPRTGVSRFHWILAAACLQLVRLGIPALFLPYELPEDGSSVILEVQAVCPPNKRSWFMRSEVLEGTCNTSVDWQHSSHLNRWQAPCHDPD